MARTIRISETIAIHRPRADVWAIVSDYATDRTWRPAITEMTPEPPGPPALGTRVREVLHQGGRDYVTESTVVALDPGRSYRFAGAGTTGQVTGGRRVTPTDDPSRSSFTYDVELTLEGATSLLGPLIAASLRRSLRADLRRLRDGLEQGTIQPSPASPRRAGPS